MATAVIMPKQGQSVESCIITKWHKNRGQGKNRRYSFSYETDKASFEEEAKERHFACRLLKRAMMWNAF